MRYCLIPAAGASSRMGGRDKLLEPVEGRPCVVTLALRAMASGAHVLVTVPDLNHPRARALKGCDAQCLAVPNAHEGMSASLRIGAAAVPDDAHGLMILPGDMPGIEAADMQGMWTAFEETRPAALRAQTKDGRAGHPVIFAPYTLPGFATLYEDRGAAALLGALGDKVAWHPLAGDRAIMDLDTPEDWASWQAEQKD